MAARQAPFCMQENESHYPRGLGGPDPFFVHDGRDDLDITLSREIRLVHKKEDKEKCSGILNAQSFINLGQRI